MLTILQLEQSCKPTSEQLNALLTFTLTVIEEAWRISVDQERRTALRLAHQGLGRLLEQELEHLR